ncbi:MAG: hypothetical protein IJT98_01595 [Prevotella sp.]|nr:hypothetical protein [Prevotella sp.]
MAQSDKDLTVFQTRIRQLILRFQELKQENKDLYAMIEDNEQQIEELKAQLAERNKEYEAMKMAKMMTISDGDLDGAKEHVASLIRNINKCIDLLSGEK